ncbi:ATP-binding cassette domain-containing protein [Escherichia coli]|uniref:ATP-binding cassette domain-containing protein n=1 Tax=Escherichia coli TaxID=562 RepID=UPI0002BA0AB5|nr:ATP-binding cassette domain-containing protein [Escherichia coli]ATB16782.1 macrolide ABC transporter ATP-binding protein [Escherichia coli]EGE3893426.1 macrolide ABC transporter ATP-binding protein [Escherichia coli]EMV65969.1 ABC transporter family protein [Escherichia coli 2866750]WNT85974.1 Lipoprotein-releasing system ATP-binding protein LolD [Escherichia coli]CAD5988872.1 ABC transporter AatC (ATP-binding protein) [Escherichia coli]
MIRLSIEKKTFSGRNIISNLNINIPKNQFTIITGASGVGKSTLLNIIGLIDLSYCGKYLFNGFDVSNIDYKEQLFLRGRYFGYIFQDSLINEKQTVLRNLLSITDLRKQSEYKYVISDLLKKVGLHDICPETPASLLSGGEKQRLALARALIKSPQILLADEPTASLDNDNKIKVMDIMLDYHKNGGTVIMITHDRSLIREHIKVISL